MATYDLFMLAILLGLTLYGYFKGMAWQIAYVASFVVSYFVAVRFADQLAPQITFVNPPANKFVAMLIIYALSAFAVWTLFRVVRRGIDSVKMEGFDHQMGAIIGFGRGVLWCVGVTFFAVTLLPAAQKQQIVDSKSGYYIARLVNETDSLFPPEVHQVIEPYLSRLGSELAPGQAGQPGSVAVPNGWPGSGVSTPPSQPAAPAWGQSAGNNPATSNWPSSPTAAAPTTPAWPSANQTPANPPAASNFGWPAAPGQAPATPPAQSASWPEWNR